VEQGTVARTWSRGGGTGMEKERKERGDERKKNAGGILVHKF
jgi:hypothetical protein